LERSEYHRAARNKVWDELPAIYGPPNWDELERIKAEI
jgi:hypothetical protein